MNKNNYGGLFVAFDGPKGVGKTTLIRCVKEDLIEKGIDVWTTKEPTNTPLGEFTRDISETLKYEGLACLIAADRYQHLNNEIIPKLSAKCVVMTDRYILSSLILQRMDNVDVNFILSIHANIIIPDIQFVVTADENIIQKRLNSRKKFITRFENGNRTNEELQYLYDGEKILHDIGFKTVMADNSGELFNSVSLISNHIVNALYYSIF